MDAVENSLVEGAILWLARTILESLLPGKLLEAWLRQVGLAGNIEELKIEIARVETVVKAAKGKATGNNPLAKSLASLKELLYDADDVVDELDYFRIQEQVKGDTTSTTDCANELQGINGDEDGDGAEQVHGYRDNPEIQSSKMRKNRCKAWDIFEKIKDGNGKVHKAKCVYCHVEVKCGDKTGTRGLSTHFNSKKCRSKRPASDQPLYHTSATDGAPDATTDATRDSLSRKRVRFDEASRHNVTPNTHPWDKTEFSERINQIAIKLQRLRGDVTEFLKDSVTSSDQYQSNTADTCLRTSSLVPPKVYGRDQEKDGILMAMAVHESDAVTVLPIVGIAGVGKTALAQLVYNHPTVETQFDRIWVWVGKNFDEVALTREILYFQERTEGMSSLAKLQEILKARMQRQSKRFLLILDDVWDSMDDHRWNKLLLPFQSSHAKGNVVLVTTRNLSVAQRIGTCEPIKLGALGERDFWLLYKTFAFGDEKNYEGHPTLHNIGRKIAQKLKGNPLAAQTAGEILRGCHSVDHWCSTLENEDWKSLQLSRGIMTALKLSYDQLPYNLQQCFLYCSIFPINYQFLAEDLVRIWISQGFVRCFNSSKLLEEIGREYFTDLVNLGIFQKIEREEPTPGDLTYYAVCGAMHDFARLISRTEYAIIDSLACNEILPTVHHLSIITDSAYNRNKKFEEKLRSVVLSVRKLRTLVLIGKYDCFFFESFKDVFQKAQCLRMLQISATTTDSNSFLCKLENSTHLRYLKLENKRRVGNLSVPPTKYYHLQVLDVGRPTTPSAIDGLVSMRHLVLEKAAHVTDQNYICFEVLQSMNELVQLDLYQLENVNRAEADGAKLRDKQHLEDLNFFFFPSNSGEIVVKASEVSIDSDTEEDSSPMDDSGQGSEVSTYSNTEEDSSPMDDMNNCPSSEQCTGTARDVLEGLEPHHNLKHLQISGYSGATSPSWLGTSVTCLQTLHLEDCGGWQRLPSLRRLPFLIKLKLRKMQKVIEVSIPPLEELVLIKMPKLKRCSCNSVRDMNSSLRVLEIKRCRVLEAFPLFESCETLKIEHKSWLSRLNELTVHDCPRLKLSNPLPPSSNTCELSISGVSTFPKMVGLSNGEFIIFDKYSDVLTELDDQILSFHNLRALTRLKIQDCQNLSSISLKGFRQLISLKTLKIKNCESLFSSDVLPEHIHEDMTDAKFSNALPSLEYLSIKSCGITGKWLSVLLQHVGSLENLKLYDCQEIKGLSIQRKESSLSDLTSGQLALSPPDEFLRIPSNLIPSLKMMYVAYCDGLTFLNKEGFTEFTSLEDLIVIECPQLISSMVHKDETDDGVNGRWVFPHSLGHLGIVGSLETLQPCFLGNLTILKNFELECSPGLKSLPLHSCTTLEKLELVSLESLEVLEGFRSLGGLRQLDLSDCPRLNSVQLHSCTALETLRIDDCRSLEALEGFQSLGGLRILHVDGCPGLSPYLESILSRRELCSRLENLLIDDDSLLTTSFSMHLTSLQCLHIYKSKMTGLTDGQERALRLLTSLQHLQFYHCDSLVDLPMSLHSLSSLKSLVINNCKCISRLKEKGLPPSLEELLVDSCNNDLIERCKELATTTTKPKVRIDMRYVN